MLDLVVWYNLSQSSPPQQTCASCLPVDSNHVLLLNHACIQWTIKQYRYIHVCMVITGIFTEIIIILKGKVLASGLNNLELHAGKILALDQSQANDILEAVY